MTDGELAVDEEGAEQVDPADQAEVRPGEGSESWRVERPAERVGAVGGLPADVRDRLDDDGGDGRGDDRDQHRALDLEHVQGDQYEDADEEHQDRPAHELALDAQFDGGAGAGSHDAGVDEADEGDEEADADRDRRAQRLGDGLEDGRAEAGEHEDGDDDALPHHEAHGLRPGHLRREGEGDERVEPETGGDAEREPSDDAHQDGHDARDQRRRGGDHADGHADGDRVDLCVRLVEEHGRAGDQVEVLVGRGADDERVQGDDVGHREERDETTTDLTPDGRAALGDVEEAVQAGLWCRVLEGGLSGRGRIRNHGCTS